MDKKTKTIVIAVLAVVVIGGLYFGINRWREQRLANQILQEVYGVNTGLFGKITGNSGISNLTAQEIAKQIANETLQQKNEEAQEAAKTPEGKYKATEEMAAYDANSKAAVNEVQPIIEKVFGKSKLTSVYTNAYASETLSYSMLEFTISRLATGADLGALNKVLTDKGLPILQSSIADKTAMVSAGNNETTMLSFGFEIDGQTIGVNITKTSQ
ncbi:MAG: hypothetical protein V1902_03180 [Candidatus Falkowbacteria bacterium]